MTTIFHGDACEVLKTLHTNSIDSIVTDPPYFLLNSSGKGFMGKDWDSLPISGEFPQDKIIAWHERWAREAIRVLKPGGHALAFSGARTYQYLALGLERAGFEVRDQIIWIHGQGFPKSLAVDKALKKLGKEEEAKKWAGFGSALKPSHEPLCIVRKPLAEKTIAENILAWGCGGLNIDASRIGTHDYTQNQWDQKQLARTTGNTFGVHKPSNASVPLGRFPSNLILSHHPDCEETCSSECAVADMDQSTGITKTGGSPSSENNRGKYVKNGMFSQGDVNISFATNFSNDKGFASRFFYQAKASKSDRGEGNNHPTVKSTKLCEYLITLITQPGGVVLDPFMGSGSTGVAAKRLGFEFIGIEKEKEYFDIALQRINK